MSLRDETPAQQHGSADAVEVDDPSPRNSAGLQVAAQADILAKLAVLVMVMFLLANPDWGNLEGKAPVERALSYPVLALVVPALWLARGRPQAFPWVADLMVTIPAFSDLLGNRLDLYDKIVWFDDWMHFMNTGLLTAAFLLLAPQIGETTGALMTRAVAFGLTASLVWELFELSTFVLQSTEVSTAYVDTIMDLSLGWLGAVTAGCIIALARDRFPREPLPVS